MALKLETSIKLVQEVISLYGIDQVALSFNGGKDCTVLLYLLQLAGVDLSKLRVIYFRNQEEFKEVTYFIDETQRKLGLNLTLIQNSFQEGLAQYLERTQVKAIFMGQRKGDPGSESLELICRSDSSWPSFNRVNPLLDWNYLEIWCFLLDRSIPYCSLYNRGYSSIGSTEKTRVNPFLLRAGRYLPAYLLKDWDQERAGRK